MTRTAWPVWGRCGGADVVGGGWSGMVVVARQTRTGEERPDEARLGKAWQTRHGVKGGAR
jgi:hypothetical protein